MIPHRKILRSYEQLAELDKTVIGIIENINGLIVQAQNENLIPVCSVLEDARESIAWWAVNEDFSQESGETLAHQLKFSTGLHIAAVIIAKLATMKDGDIKNELLELLKNFSR